MYAIMGFMGYQYKVEKDQVLNVPYINDKEIGETLDIYDILMKHDGDKLEIGTPNVNNSHIVAEILGFGKDKKVIVFKKKRRKGYKKKQGHRAKFTQIKIKEII